MKKFIAFIYLILLVTTVSPSSAEVLAWVQNGFGSVSLTNLQNSHGGVNPKDVFTAIGIQFWAPTSGGGLTTLSDPSSFVTWAHQNNIKALLTVYNAAGGSWDWGLATSAFGNAEAFSTALVNAVTQYSLDGVDLDLEGKNLTNPDDNRTQFKTFVTTLSTKLRLQGKMLTVCTYSDPIDPSGNNCPNTTWWADWVGKIDNIHTMLYAEGGEKDCPGVGIDPNDDSYYYSFQKDIGIKAGYPSTAVSMGLPTYDAEGAAAWQTNATTHLDQCYNLKSSICLWDMQLVNSSWQSSSTIWQKLKSFKTLLSAFTLTLRPGAGGAITANPNQTTYPPGTQVTLTATPSSGNTFTGWGGDMTGSQNPATITMNDYKTVTASFSGGALFDMIAGATWDTTADPNKSKITFTNTNNTIAASWTLAKAPNDTAEIWVNLGATYVGDYKPLTSLKITYKSSDPLDISFNQDPISSDGEGYMKELPAATSATTLTLQADTNTFHQPSWVTKVTPFNLGKVSGLDFTPGVEGSTTSSKSGTFTISDNSVAHLAAI